MLNVPFFLPGRIGNRTFDSWVARRVDGSAAACFVCNLIAYFCQYSQDSNKRAWQPEVKASGNLKYLDNGTIQSLPVESCFNAREADT